MPTPSVNARRSEARRLGAAVGLVLLLVGVVPAEVAYAVAPPKPRCKVVPEPRAAPRSSSGPSSATSGRQTFVVTVPHVVCTPARPPVTVAGGGGGEVKGGSGGAGGLPFTGFALDSAMGMGLLMLMGGACAAFVGRRRRRTGL